MDIQVGTSGYSYPEWKGSFYPADLPARSMLSYYAGEFRTVEINNTFHRMPKAGMLEAWAEVVPADFRFVLKAPQRITHIQRLKDVEDSVSYLLAVSAVLRERLGAVLFQLPPGLKKDRQLLRDFLALLPSQRQFAIEFRHHSWFEEEIFALLRRGNVAICVADTDDGVQAPLVSTADWGYLRLRRSAYHADDLKAWVKRVKEQPWREAFVFFKHEEEAKGPLFAKRFLELAA